MSLCIVSIREMFDPKLMEPNKVPHGLAVPMSDVKSGPVYMDMMRRPYDKYYRRIFKTPVVEDSKMLGPLRMQGYSDKVELNELKFPSPKGYTSKEEYSAAVTDWKKKVQDYFQYTQFPVPVTDSFYRPEKPSIVSRDEMRRFKPELASPLPRNYNKMIDAIINGDEIDPDEEFPVQLPHRNIVKMKHQLSGEKQWQGILAPPEPNPIYYDSFEQFYDAYKRWRLVCRETMDIRIPNPTAFTTLNFDKVQDGEVFVNKEMEKVDTGNAYSWVKSVTKGRTLGPNAMVQLGKLCKYCSYVCLDCKSVPCMVFGVDGTKFVARITNGCDQEALKSNRPCYPFASFIMNASQDSKETIADIVTNPNIPDIQVIFELMRRDFDQIRFQEAMEVKRRVKKPKKTKDVLDSESIADSLSIDSQNFFSTLNTLSTGLFESKSSAFDLDSITPPIEHDRSLNTDDLMDRTHKKKTRTRTERTMTISGKAPPPPQAKHNGIKVVKVLKSRLKPVHIMKSLYIGKQSPLLYARMAIFLNVIVNTDLGPKLFDELLIPSRVNLLFVVVSEIIAMSNMQIILVHPSSESEFALEVSQFHLLSSLLMDPERITSVDMSNYLREKCRVMSLRITEVITRNETVRNDLWNSLESNKKSDKSRLMDMIATSSIVHLTRAVIGSDFFRRGNEVSKYDIGRLFLLRLMYNSSGFDMVSLFTSCEYPDDVEFTPFFVMIMRNMTVELGRYLHNYGLSFDTMVMMPLFRASSIASTLSFLVPVAELCCDRVIAQKFSLKMYQNKLAEICSMICESGITMGGALELLEPFFQVECCVEVITGFYKQKGVSNPNIPFVKYIVETLTSNNMKESTLSWRILFQLSNFDYIFSMIFAMEIFAASFTRLSDASFAIVGKFIEFMLVMWDAPSVIVRDAVFSTLMPALGRISCLCVTAGKKLEAYPGVLQLVNDFIEKVGQHTGTPTQITFSEGLQKHMEGEGKAVQSPKRTTVVKN